MKCNDSNKWQYIRLISNISSIHSEYLLELMDKYNRNNLQEVTFEEAKEYYDYVVKKINNERTYLNMYVGLR